MGRSLTRPRAAAGFAVFGLAVLAGQVRISSWALTQWLFDYDDGVVRRGLAGEALGAFGPPTQARTLVATLVVAAVLVLTGSWAVARASVGDGEVRTGRLALGTALLASSGGFPYVAASLGRLEHLGILLVVAGGAAVVRWRHGEWLAALLGVVAVLVHEGTLLLLLPWLAAFAAHRGRRWWVVLVPAALVVGWLSAQTPPVPMDDLVERLEERTDIEVDENAVRPLYADTEDNVEKVAEVLARQRAATLPLSVLAALPLAAFAVWRLRGHRDARWMALASLAPIALTFVGIDFGRWFAFSAALLAVTAMVVPDRDDVPVHVLARWVLVVLLASIAAGPTDATGFLRLWSAIAAQS